MFKKSDFARLNKLLNETTPEFDFERDGKIVDHGHVLITNQGEAFQSTNQNIFENDVLIDPNGRRYIVISLEQSVSGQVLGKVTTGTKLSHQQSTINVGGDAVIGNNNNAFNTTVNSNVATITNEVENSGLSDEDKAELTKMLETIENSPALPKGFLAKFEDFFATHPRSMAALGNLLVRVITGMSA
jgi:hypothetical protein